MISGFTIIRNGLKFDFPFLESIRSALPICDEFVINVGASEDATRQAIEQLRLRLSTAEAAKIKIIETVWPLDDPEQRKGGRILADQTNLALGNCQHDWCFYLQGDEVLHEDDHEMIRAQLGHWVHERRIEAVVFEYVHFYGSYGVVQTSRSSYRREVRVVRNGLGIRSTGDAQSFRHADDRKLNAVLTKARVFHYGWVRPQEIMKQKTGFMDTLYHPSATADAPATGDNYVYKRIVGLKEFKGTHPAVMRERVQNAPVFDFSSAPKVFHLKDSWKLVSGLIENATGIRPFEYRNYNLIKP
ncbi:MAG: glycosyltransferase family 2 protein [Deltaproteobacteria bacterium]|nr:glycosyltransferase family 2 protein [Deltaproteobacteria bacterium]